MVDFCVISRFVLCLCIYCLLPVAESDGTVDCFTKFTDFDDDMNTFNVTCPADCSGQYSASVWGTGVYGSVSSICRAAIHDGRITDDGGQVTVYRWPGQDSYQDSYNNSVQTFYYYQSWPVSFAFTQDTVWCSTDSTVFDDDPFTVTCPAGCSPHEQYSERVWGTGVYTSDSSICRAAIHDGRIPDDGGQVTVYRWPRQNSYQGSTQNGIESYGYSYYYSSFAFTRVCRDALGMEHGTIEDDDITASSNQQQSWPPSAARLKGDGAWRPSSTFEGSWIQVDLGLQTTVSGVITQGYGWNYWVTQYQVRYLNNDGTWVTVTSPTGHAMTFSGNTDSNGQKTHMFYRTIVAQQVRLYPTSWQRGPSLRMELLGCDFIASTTQSTTGIRTTYITQPTTVRNTIFTTLPTTVIKTTATTQSTTAIKTTSTYTTQSTTVIKTTSTTQSTTVTRTKSSISQSTAPAHTSPQTVHMGSFSSATLSTTVFSTELIDGNREEQKGAKGSISVGAIAGIAAGAAVVLIAMVVFVIVLIGKRQSNNNGASNVPRSAPEQRFRNPEYSGAAVTNEHTASAQDEGYTDCELYNNTEDNNPYETYNYANPGQISGGEISQPHDYDYATIPGESDRGVVDNVIYESSDMT